MALKVVFAGTPTFALDSLQALLASEHEIVAVYTQPDRPSGRGRKLTQTPVKQFALQHDLPIYQPTSLKDEYVQKQLQELGVDVIVDVAFGLLVPQVVLDMFPFGCINLHPSLLPRWRGAAPIQRAILAGDSETGVTIMQMDAGWDTGAILQQTKITMSEHVTAATLTQQLAVLGAELLLDTMAKLEAKTIKATPQDDAASCYADKLTKEGARLDWHLSSLVLERTVRAFNPWPIAFSELDGNILRIWEAEAIASVVTASVGEIISADKKGIDVATGAGILRITKLQLSGGKPLSVAEILNSKQDMFMVGKSFNA